MSNGDYAPTGSLVMIIGLAIVAGAAVVGLIWWIST